MRGKLSNNTISLISAVFKDNIYDDSWRAIYKYACTSCGEFSRCPYSPFRFGESRVCLRRISFDHKFRMNLYCDIEDPTQCEKFIAFLNGKAVD